MSLLQRTYMGLRRCYEGGVILAVAAMLIVVFANVFSRYVLNYSLGWVDELARFLFIWVVFLGAVLAFEKDEHVGIDFVVGYIPEKPRRYIGLIAEIAIFAVLIIITYYGWIVALSARNISPGLEIRMTYVYIVAPISAAFMSVISLRRINQCLQAIIHPTKEAKKEVTI